MRIPLLDKLMEGPERKAIDRAARLLDQGKIDAAVQTLRAGVAKVPGNPALQLELGRVLTAASRGGEAASVLRSLLRTNPDAVDPVLELAEMGRYEGRDVGHLHDLLAEHFLRRGSLAEAQSHLEKIDRSELGRYAAAHKKRLEAGLSGGAEGVVARASLLSGVYVAMAHEAAGEDPAALETYSRLLRAAPDLYPRLRERLQAMASRNYREVACRMRILDLYLASGDSAAAADEAGLLLEAVPAVAPKLAGPLADALHERPERADLRLVLARVCWAEGRRDEAVETLEPLAQAGEHDEELGKLLSAWRVEHPDAARVSLMLAEILGRGGKGSQAIQAVAEIGEQLPPEQLEPALERLIEANPGEGRAYRLLAELRQGQGDADGVVEAIARLRRDAPAHAGEAAGVLRAVLEANPAHRTAHRFLAEILLERGELDGGVLLLRDLLRLEPSPTAELAEGMETLAGANPGHLPARLGAAEAWMLAGEAARALPHLEAAGTEPSLSAQVAHRLSSLLRRAPDQAAAVAGLAERLEGKLADPAALPFLRAECAFAGGDPDRAARHLGESYGHGGGRAAGAVLKLLDRLVEAHPESSPPRMMMANLLADHGDPLRAVQVVADAPDPDPGMVSLLLERLEKMLAGRPQEVETRTGLARLLLFAGRPADAAAAAEEAILAAGPDAPGGLYLVRGEARMALGETEEAVGSLCRAVEVDGSISGRARAALEAAREASPREAALLRALARVRSGEGDVEGALAVLSDLATTDVAAALEEALSLAACHGEDPRPRLAVARMHAISGEPALAADALEGALAAGAEPGLVEAELASLIEDHPGEPGPVFLLAACRAEPDPAGATLLLERAAEQSAESAARALEALAGLCGANPGLPDPALAAARIHLAGEEPAEAFAALEPWLGREAPPAGAADLLRRIRTALPEAPGPAMALARLLLDREDREGAREQVLAAREAGAGTARLLPLLDRLLQAGEDGELRLLRAALREEGGDPDGALEDLEGAAAARPAETAAAVGRLLERRPDHGGARRLHVALLRAAGDDPAARASLDAALEAGAEAGERCELLLERAELRRAAGDEPGAGEDLKQAAAEAPDPDAMLELVHRRRARRQGRALEEAGPADRARMLIDLGRLEEAARALEGAEVEEGERRTLRAVLCLARGETATGLRRLRAAPPTPMLVDAAQRCDRPELALAAIDRLLEAGESPALRRARERVARDLWRIGLDPGRRALVGRTSFVHRDQEERRP